MADETPDSKVLTRRQRKEFVDSQKLDSAPMKFFERMRPHGSECPITSREREAHVQTPVPCKSSPRGTVQPSTCVSKKTFHTKKSTSSSVARRKQLELQAAEAKAKIQMELIDKKLEADLAKVDANDNQHADTDVTPDDDNGINCSLPDEQSRRDNVEQWLDHNYSLTQPPQPHNDSVQQLAKTLQDMMKQSQSAREDRLLSRLTTPRDLPTFSGDYVEWLHFKCAYEESNRVCRFSDSENLWRLRRALRAEAKEAVTDLLIGNTPPSAVIEALELRFGRADIIIQNITTQLKKLPSLPNYYQQELISFAVKVNNCVATIRALDEPDYLRSPELVAAVVSKLPSTLMAKWTEFAYNRLREGKSKMELKATFLKIEAEMLSIVGCNQPREYRKPIDAVNKRTDDKPRHRSVYTSAVTEEKKCLFCKRDNHVLSDCRIFKRAMRKDRWRFVKAQRLCYCCLSTKQHSSNLRPAPVCDVDDCGMAHHRLLHWTRPTVTSQSADAPPICRDDLERDTPDDAAISHIARNDDVTDPSTTSTTEEFALLKVIPRLELQGALIASRLADTLLREQKDMKPDKRYFWTDSHTVLQWIRSDPRSYKPFVAHRLGEIDELTVTSEWRYVPTKLNVADIATKEESPPLTYDSVWFQGPGFLRQPEETWPKDLKSAKTSHEAACESRNVNVVMTSHAIDYSLPNENNFSSWTRLVRTTARVLLFVKRCRRSEVQFNVELLNEAEKLLLKKSQYDVFAHEIEQLKQNKPLLSTSRLLTLTPYLDSDGILRVQGRVDKVQGVERSTMRPVILDGHHQMTRLLVEYYHRKALHGAHELVVNELRQRYWILKLRPTVRAVASRCLFCRHRRAAPQPQRMADLPAARLQHHRRPFTFTGIDFFGPMEVTVGRKRQKRYGVIFTCLTIRAIHLELTESLSTDSAIMALRRMIARRATPSVIFSDNGTNLRGADNELKRSVLELDHSKLREDGTTRGIEWRFIPPGAPEMGGAWERMIRTVKTALKVVLKERAPQLETLSTLITEVEALVNSRPITYVSCDPKYPEALTPNHFLIGTSSNGPALGRYDNDDLCLRKQWRIAQRLADMFWGRWLKEYLPTLLPRYKWNKDQRALRDGDFVLLIEPNLDRGSWRHGVVSGTHGGDDGRVRVVDVRTRTGMVRRPVTRVALLEPAEC